MDSFIVIILVSLSVLFTFLLTRHYYQQHLIEIKRLVELLAKGDVTKGLAVGHHRTHEIALILNEVSNKFANQLLQVANQKDKLEAIFSSLTEGVIVVGSQGKLQHVSPNIRHMLEMRSLNWDDRPYWEIISHQQINEAIKDALNDKQAIKREIVEFSSPQQYFSMQISPVINTSNNLIAVIAVLHDITELKQLELMRAEFVANVSHELKTPLTSIKGYTETLIESIHDDPSSAPKFLEIIKKQAQRLENIVNDLLILSSLESNAIKMDFQKELIAPIIHSVIQVHQQLINERQLKIDLSIENNLPPIRIDKLRIEQVLLNLIDNAIKFTPINGKIILSVKKQGDMLEVKVSDTGVGIAPEHLSRVFERFYRVDKARSRETGGTGLGLSIVHQIVTAHQGKIQVESTINRGSTFTVTLPISR